jgi:hypothetical protein
MSKHTPFGWAKRDGSFRTEVPDNPIGWTPLYAWTAFPWSEQADLLKAAKSAAAFIAQRSRPGKSDPLADRTMATIQAALNKAVD